MWKRWKRWSWNQSSAMAVITNPRLHNIHQYNTNMIYNINQYQYNTIYYNTNMIYNIIQYQYNSIIEDWASALWGNVWSLKPPTPSISFKSYIWDTDYQYDDKDHKCGQSINHVDNIKMINMIKIITNLSPRCNPPLPPLLPPLMLQNLEMVNILGFYLI